MIGTRIAKEPLDAELYRRCAMWCNDTQRGIIRDMGDDYEVIPNPSYEDEETQRVKALRERRETECFSVINRGKPWYDRLTEHQRAELDAWYQMWLDAPVTGEAPERLPWLD